MTTQYTIVLIAYVSEGGFNSEVQSPLIGNEEG